MNRNLMFSQNKIIKMRDSGIYSLIIKLDKDLSIKIGKFGRVNFPKGFYIYTGSALNGLKSRIDRHRRKKKKKLWHIDYLLASKHTKILEVIAIEIDKRLECRLNGIISSLPNSQFLVKGFGCSDCKCKSHLVYFGSENLIKQTKQALNLINK